VPLHVMAVEIIQSLGYRGLLSRNCENSSHDSPSTKTGMSERSVHFKIKVMNKNPVLDLASIQTPTPKNPNQAHIHPNPHINIIHLRSGPIPIPFRFRIRKFPAQIPASKNIRLIIIRKFISVPFFPSIVVPKRNIVIIHQCRGI
jgi:hypothetical protein